MAGASLGSAQPGFLLPGDVVPVRYTVQLTVDPNRDTFDGTIVIELDVRASTRIIWLNARDIEPESASLSQGDVVQPVRARVVGRELLAIDARVNPGRAAVRIQYRARLDEKAVLGAYRRKVAGNWYVYTTFTPIEARKAFPCFDELRYKTPWQFTIKVSKGERAFTNAPETRETTADDGSTEFYFGETKPLPTELVTFAVGPFDIYMGAPAPDGTPVRVITPKGAAKSGEAGAAATLDVLPRLESYTGIPYPFGKLDYVALEDGAFGAVENPGLITYLARELLMVPGSETISRTHDLRLLEAHELAHQWFGDLVTQASWADVWLSEGFATWLSEKAMDEEGSAERAHFGLMEARERIMQVDESRRTRPVRVEPHDREGTRDIYNRIVYDKGASVLWMLEDWLGGDKTREALRAYLHDHEFGNASTADLEAELKKASGMDPSAVMHSFLDATGVPRVSFQIECGSTARLKIHQTGASAIPVCYRGPGVPERCTEVDGPSKEVELPQDAGCPAWMEPNAGASGYYRTVWTTAQLAALPTGELTSQERLMLAFDTRAMTQGPDRPAARAVAERLKTDPEAEVRLAAEQVSGR